MNICLSNRSVYDLLHGRFHFSTESAWLRAGAVLLTLVFFAILLWKLPVWVIAGVLIPKHTCGRTRS